MLAITRQDFNEPNNVGLLEKILYLDNPGLNDLDVRLPVRGLDVCLSVKTLRRKPSTYPSLTPRIEHRAIYPSRRPCAKWLCVRPKLK